MNWKEQLESWAKNRKTLPLSLTLGGSIHVNPQSKPLPTTQKLDASSDPLPAETTPVAEDFVDVTYRALSATTLADRPIDFSNEKMLKKSAPLLVGQTVFKDHYTSVDNWVGRVMNTSWDTKTEGFPPGINATLRLDTVKDPMAVRGVLQGALHSASVTVSFDWEPSHPKLMEDGSFFNKLGETVDGEVVRVVATDIQKFWEISLVWQGADQYAKQIGQDGKPVVSASANVSQSTVQGHTHEGHASISQGNHTLKPNFHPVISLKLSTNQPEENDMNFKELLKQFFGLEVTEENVKEQLKGVADKLGLKDLEIEKLTRESASKAEALKTVKAEAEELKSKVAELSPQAEIGKKYLEDERKEAIRFYNLSKGDKASPVILKTLEEASLEVIQAWKEDLKTEFEAKVPLKCQKCQSTEVQRRSSVEGTEQEATEKPAVLLSETAQKAVSSIHN